MCEIAWMSPPTDPTVVVLPSVPVVVIVIVSQPVPVAHSCASNCWLGLAWKTNQSWVSLEASSEAPYIVRAVSGPHAWPAESFGSLVAVGGGMLAPPVTPFPGSMRTVYGAALPGSAQA